MPVQRLSMTFGLVQLLVEGRHKGESIAAPLYPSLQVVWHSAISPYLHLHTHTHTHIYIYTYTSTCAHTHSHTHTHTHTHMNACTPATMVYKLQVVRLKRSGLLLPQTYPRLTLLGQAVGSVLVAMEALGQVVPEVRAQYVVSVDVKAFLNPCVCQKKLALLCPHLQRCGEEAI